MKNRNVFRKGFRLKPTVGVAVALVTGLALLNGCGDGKLEEKDPLKAYDESKAGANGADLGENIQFKFPNRLAPADLVFMVETDGPHRGGLIRDRLERAVEGLSARWRFVKSDFRMAVAPLSVPDRDQAGKQIKATQLDKGFGLFFNKGQKNQQGQDIPDTPPFLTNATTDPKVFAETSKTLFSRIFDTNDESWQRAPLAAPIRYLQAAKGAKELRAWTSIVMISSAPDEGEETKPESLIADIEAITGGNWSLTVIGVPEGGCTPPGDNQEAIGKNDPTKPDDQKYVYLSDKIAKAAGPKGTFVSICSDSFGGVLHNALVGVGLPSQVGVQLKYEPQMSTLSVTTKEGNVIGWTYSKETKKLLLPGFIPSGKVVTIDYRKASGTGTNKPVEFAKAPAIIPVKLTPELIKFLDEADPILQRNCGPCHAPGGNRARYVGSFENVARAAEEIKMRINLADGNAQKMPQGRNMSAEDLKGLNDYLDSLAQ